MSLPCFVDASMGVSAVGSACAAGGIFNPLTALAGMAFAGIAYGIAKIIKNIKGTKYQQPPINTDALHRLKQKQQRTTKSNKSSNNNKEPNKKPSVDNMEKFFLTEFGRKIIDYVEKTKKQFQGQSIYKVIEDIKGTVFKKGYQFYLDALHKDHFEVFDKKGKLVAIINLDGKMILSKLAKAFGRRLV